MFKLGVIIMALSTSLFGNWFTNLFDSTPTPTIKIPVDLTETGVIVNMEFRVDYKESTRFSLDFKCTDVKLDKGKDCKEMRKFLGLNGYLYGNREKIKVADYEYAKHVFGDMIDKTYDLDGTRTPLKISLQRVEENGTFSTVIDKTYDTKGQNGSGRDIMVKYLNKGKYKLKIENLEAFKELNNRQIVFRIQSTYRK